MIEIHSAALDSRVASYHEFLARYSKSAKVVYGFVEGKDDPAFYRGFIDSMLPEDWQVELWGAGNKKRVYEIHTLLNWRRFSKKRVCFFVDRDLSEILPEKLPKESNIYVTSGYSIENDVVKKDVCKRMLVELFGLSAVDHAELERVEALFDSELDKFCKFLIPVMAWIVAWKRNGKRPSLNDILMRDLFSFSTTSIQQVAKPKGHPDWAAYIHSQCNIAFDATVDLAPIAMLLTSKSNYRLFARGKYVFWFLIEFCHAVHKNAPTLFLSVQKIPKLNLTISHTNAMAVIGPRARLPGSLKKFLNETFLAFIGRAKGFTTA